jgi:8-oxo-dGTP pyrophosphatase MutT (NUDIX family)
MLFKSIPDNFSSRFEIVSIFVNWNGKFLLLRRQDHKPQGDTWGVPAGKVEKNEDKSQSVLRELKEETGIVALSEDVNFRRTVFVRFPDYNFVYHMYSLDLQLQPNVIIDIASHKDYVWVTPEEALKIKLMPDLDACIKIEYETITH